MAGLLHLLTGLAGAFLHHQVIVFQSVNMDVVVAKPFLNQVDDSPKEILQIGGRGNLLGDFSTGFNLASTAFQEFLGLLFQTLPFRNLFCQLLIGL